MEAVAFLNHVVVLKHDSDACNNEVNLTSVSNTNSNQATFAIDAFWRVARITRIGRSC
jgi:hypothetical protein